jgi:hypothetical protein
MATIVPERQTEGLAMKYMLMIYGNKAAWDSLTRDLIAEIGRTHRTLQNELSASGELLDHKELALDNAKVVRTNRGIPIVTDGPFVGDKEILGGYYLVNCVSLARATEIAGRFLEAEFAPIEVHRLSGDTTWDTGAPTV